MHRFATWLFGVLILYGGGVLAQPDDRFIPLTFQTERVYNLFIPIASDNKQVEAIKVHLPEGWLLRDVRVFDTRVYRKHPVDWNQRYIRFERFLSGKFLVVLTVQTAPYTGTYQLEIEPVLNHATTSGKSAVETLRKWVTVIPSTPPSNRRFAWKFSGKETLVFQALLPESEAFTVGGWIKTTQFPAVVFSTWTGREEEAYPMELIIDEVGRLAVYRGQEGLHQSLVSQTPIADGRWHHVAVSYAGEERITLMIDGVVEDSLLAVAALPAFLSRDVALGGRLPVYQETLDEINASLRFEGVLDQWQLYPRAYTVEDMERMRRWYRCSPAAQCLDPDNKALNALLEEETHQSVERIPSDLMISLSLEQLSAQVDGQWITLSWVLSSVDQNGVFFIERSTDGIDFQPVGEVHAQHALWIEEENPRFTFTDRVSDQRVAYYRIRYRVEDEEVVSGIIKVGVGMVEEVKSRVIGNFPNPAQVFTQIRYMLAADGFVRLSIWDLSGQLIARLVDQEQPAGVHEVEYSVEHLPSGTYIVRMETSEGVSTHTMIVAH